MTVKQAVSALGLVVAVFAGGAVSSASDYPPSGVVVVVKGDLTTGSTIEVAVQNCEVGEQVRTSIGEMSPVESRCASGPSSLFEGVTAVDARPGIARQALVLPDEPGEVVGRAHLLGSDQTISFLLDVREPESAAPEIAPGPDTRSNGLRGWPFLVLAALIVLSALVLAGRRQRYDETP